MQMECGKHLWFFQDNMEHFEERRQIFWVKACSDAAGRRHSSIRESTRDKVGAVLYAAGSGWDVTDSGGGCRAWQSVSCHTAQSSSTRRRRMDLPLVQSGRKS